MDTAKKLIVENMIVNTRTTIALARPLDLNQMRDLVIKLGLWPVIMTIAKGVAIIVVDRK